MRVQTIMAADEITAPDEERLAEPPPELPSGPGRRRVAPMPPDDRRAALVEATLPLLREFGVAVSTRQIADAAGVAEGTIFRVFPDKNALLVATVIRGLSLPEEHRPMWGIDAGAVLRTRLITAIEMLTTNMRALGRLPEVMRTLMGNEETRDAIAPVMDNNRREAMRTFVELLEPDAARLRIGLHHAARITLMMTFSSSGFFDDSETLTSEEIVAVLLDGLLAPPAESDSANGDHHRAP